MPVPIGDILDGRYEILAQVGEGAMGVVYRARHVHLGRQVAVKLLRPEISDNDEMVQRFLREARSTSAIGHPNIVNVFDFQYQSGGLLYLAMEWLEGETLEAKLKKSVVPLPLALSLSIEALTGLQAAHEAGVVHRDMKPANLFLPEGSNVAVKILDFGIAKLLSDDSGLTQTGTMVGTPHYLSPEQAYGDPVDARSDLYSLGVILYEMVTGVLPFNAETPMTVVHMQATQMPEPPSQRAPLRNIDQDLESLIMRCLAKKPVERWESAKDVADALRTIRQNLKEDLSRPTAAGNAVVPPASPASTMPMTPKAIRGPLAQGSQELGRSAAPIATDAFDDVEDTLEDAKSPLHEEDVVLLHKRKRLPTELPQAFPAMREAPKSEPPDDE